jgi:hypothetical protein
MQLNIFDEEICMHIIKEIYTYSYLYSSILYNMWMENLKFSYKVIAPYRVPACLVIGQHFETPDEIANHF